MRIPGFVCTALLALVCFQPSAIAQTKPEAKPAGVAHTFTFTFKLKPNGVSRNVTLKVAVPRTIAPWQTIDKIEYSHKPASDKTKGDARYAEFKFAEIRKPLTLTIAVKARLDRPDYATLSRQKNRLKTPPPAKEYTLPEKFIESNDKAIVAAAKSIGGRTRVEQVRGIMNFVGATLTKSRYDPVDHGAVWVMQRRSGDCTEYSDLFVALCRAKGIPARCCEGFLNFIPRGDTPKHIWVEVYFDKLGWVAFDPLHVDLRIASFSRMQARYLKISGTRNDAELNGYHFFSYVYENDRLNVTDTFAVRKDR